MSFTDFDLAAAAQVAEDAARAAGALIREAYRRPRHVIDKGVNELVTHTDRASEALIVSRLAAAFPDHNLTGQEGAHYDHGSPYTWWIDPLDGTYNFVHGVPRFSVSLGLVDQEGYTLLGLIYDPMFDECFRAVRGAGATCNREPAHVSQTMALREALAASGFPADLRAGQNNTAEWAAFVPRCQGVARMGSAALDLCYVACGRFDLFWENKLAPWDTAAGLLIVQEAGGQVSDYYGAPFDFLQRGGLLASNGLVHDEALSVFSAVRRLEESETP